MLPIWSGFGFPLHLGFRAVPAGSSGKSQFFFQSESFSFVIQPLVRLGACVLTQSVLTNVE